MATSESYRLFPRLFHTDQHFSLEAFPFSDAEMSDATTASPYDISEYERTTYYNGIASGGHPELLYRSDLLDNPFPRPTGRHALLPTKSVRGVYNTPLNKVWGTVAPQICDLLKARKILYSAINTARFVTHGEDEKDTLGPIVIWIATHPGTTTTETAHDASPDILKLLEDNGVKGAVVEWYEGAVERLAGPPLLRVVDNNNPTHYVRRFLTAALGMAIATAEREEDAQGSVTLFFHENKDKHGNPSSKVFGVSNCHVLREDTTVKYEFEGAGAPPQHVRLAGSRRFQRGLDEIKACISGHGIDADLLVREIVELEAKEKSKDPDEAADDTEALRVKREKLAKEERDTDVLEKFYHEVKNQWGDIARRNIGHVHWAPEISVDVEGRRYTLDIGTFEVDPTRFKDHFKGNVVDLGALTHLSHTHLVHQKQPYVGSKFTPRQLTDMFYPQSGGRTTFKFPTNGLLRIKGFVTPELLANPDLFDSNGEPCLVVMKEGNTSGLTVGCYAGMEAYLCSELGVESVELAIYNYNKQSGPFSAKGDSGSLIFDGQGRMVGILRSGMSKGGSSHVTYATPAWWAMEQLRIKYPHADFNRVTF